MENKCLGILFTMKLPVLLLLGICCYTTGWAQNYDTSHVIICYIPQIASYPGGRAAFADFVKRKALYPEKARTDGVEGTVVLQFRVDSCGVISLCKILKSVRCDIDAEAIRLILSTKWIPAMIGDKKVESYIKIPIRFSLT